MLRVTSKPSQLWLYAIFILSILLGSVELVLAQEQHLLKEVRYVMGSNLEISLYQQNKATGAKLLNQAFEIAQNLEKVLSNYSDQSELSKFNASPSTLTFKASTDFFNFIELSQKLNLQTEGAFDITIRPLVELWQDAKTKNKIPTQEQIKQALECVGQKLILKNANEIIKPCALQKLESGGIGKGFAVDKIVTFFKQNSVDKALIHFGRSSTYAIGAPPNQKAWQMLVEFEDNKPLGLIELKDLGLSASSSLGQEIRIGKQVIGHILDPLTGKTINHKIQSIVLTDSATSAEAWSKYIILRGLPNEVQIAQAKIQAAFLKTDHGIQQTKIPVLNK